MRRFARDYKKTFAQVFLLFAIFITTQSPYADSSLASTQQAQTDVDRAEHIIDAQGIPILKIGGVGEQRHPGWIAVYALAYAGVEAYDQRLLNLKNKTKFQACIDWLKNNLKQRQDGLWVWEYHFDSTYNDVSIKAPWSSAFGQAMGIQAFLAAYKQNGNPEYLDLAKKAAKSLFTPIAQGGFLYRNGQDIWFEEIPVPVDNPSHILNGHMRALLALKELADTTHDNEIETYFKQGSDTLYRWLPLYDTGYWLRYDLNPKKSELLFRFTNPYGFENYPLAIHKITLRDPLTKEEISLNVGTDGDSDGKARIAGVHWGQPEKVAGKQVRRLLPAALENKPDELAAPHSYFYLSLPSEWNNNLRKEWYELVIDYYDEARANITLQQRSIAPGQTFRDMRDGDLHITGAGQWREWIIPVRPSDLGYWVGESYAEKHAQYLKKLTEYDSRYKIWNNIAYSYLNTAILTIDQYVENKAQPNKLPKQFPMLPVCSLDSSGVIMENQSNCKTKFSDNGQYDVSSDPGTPRYSPYLVADQVIHGKKGRDPYCWEYYKINLDKIKRKNALHWLFQPKNQIQIGNAVLFPFLFDNIYNDVISEAPWVSSFSQSYVTKALIYAKEHIKPLPENINSLLQKIINSYDLSVENGGIKSINQLNRLPFFEEVPASTHILNSHLVSLNTLIDASKYINDTKPKKLARSGIASLKESLHLFDTGYWFRYDLNPKKNVLVQIDWVSGERSLLLEKAQLLNPMDASTSIILVGEENSFQGSSYLAGTDWEPSKIVDGRAVRGFRNGYKTRSTPTVGGSFQNTYLRFQLPQKELLNYFSLPVFQLVIRYKDIVPGDFLVKIQSINKNGKIIFFTPLHGGFIKAIGDQQWKEKRINVRPQDLGWFKGKDYQEYEVAELEILASKTQDWLFKQYVERGKYYISIKDQSIIETSQSSDNLLNQNQSNISIIKTSPTYPEFGFENAFNKEPSSSYVAGIEGEKLAFVEIKLSNSIDLNKIFIQWENKYNYAQHVDIYKIEKKHGQTKLFARRTNQSDFSFFRLKNAKGISKIRLEFSQFAGQPRVLLRNITFNPMTKNELNNENRVFLSATDKNNPLRYFHFPITQDIYIGVKSIYKAIK